VNRIIVVSFAAGLNGAGEEIPTPTTTTEPSGYPGTLIWRFPMGDWVSSSPGIYQGAIYAGSWDHHLYAIDAESGALRWKYRTGAAVRSSPAVFGDTLYVGSDDGFLYALAATTGEFHWKHQTQGWVHSSPAVYEGVVYFGSQDRKEFSQPSESEELKEMCRTTKGR